MQNQLEYEEDPSEDAGVDDDVYLSHQERYLIERYKRLEQLMRKKKMMS